VISRSGCFPSCFPDANKIFTGQYPNSPPKAIILVGVQKHLAKELGVKNESRLWKIFVDNPKKLGKRDIKLVNALAESLMTYWFIGHQNPVSLFQQALSNPI
tara:strand:- start:265 stop:570 length:306 start_codon:yes stop_codon:yes gene_type:complete